MKDANGNNVTYADTQKLTKTTRTQPLAWIFINTATHQGSKADCQLVNPCMPCRRRFRQNGGGRTRKLVVGGPGECPACACALKLSHLTRTIDKPQNFGWVAERLFQGSQLDPGRILNGTPAKAHIFPCTGSAERVEGNEERERLAGKVVPHRAGKMYGPTGAFKFFTHL